MRHGAAHETGVQHARQRDVVDKTAAPAQQHVILDAPGWTRERRVGLITAHRE
jgi:hypothetical protein